jgi:GH15 family glucan-1,4-alpha-glucosidase
MSAKGVEYIEVYFEDKTKRPLALMYVIVGDGEFVRRDRKWLPSDTMDPALLDGAEYIVLEKEDAEMLKLEEKFDNNEDISRDEVFRYGTDAYDGI